MKREFLEELGLEKDNIDKIMAVNGADIEKYKLDLTSKNEELDGVKKQLDEADATIKGFEDLNIDDIKKASEDWKIKYETDTEILKEQIRDRDFDYAIEKFLNDYAFTSDLAKKAVLHDFKTKDFKLEDGKILGAKDFMETIKEQNPTAFKSEEDPKSNPPKVSSSGIHKEDGISDSFLDSMMRGAGLGKKDE